MARICYILLILSSSHILCAQTYDYSIGRQIEKIDSFRYWINEYESLGVKQTGYSALDSAKDWLLDKYISFGYTDIQLDTFYHSGFELYNIIVEKTGLDANKWLIIGAHYDSRNGPGANDNGSGIVACLEIAKILKNIETRAGIRIVNFSAEEQGLIGSTHYVNTYLDENEEIHLMLNLDQLGGTNGLTEDNKKIYCERDQSGITGNNSLSVLMTDTLAALIRAYTFLEPVYSNAVGSDYIPFEQKGYTITGLYQYSDYSPFYHNPQDLVVNMDLDALQQVIQGALAAAMYFGRHTLPLNITETEKPVISFYPNPASGVLNFTIPGGQTLDIELYNLQGEAVLEQRIDLSNPELALSALSGGVYFMLISDTSGYLVQHSKLIIAP